MLHISPPSQTGAHRPSASLPQSIFFAEEYEFFLALSAPKISFLEFETIECNLPTEQIGKVRCRALLRIMQVNGRKLGTKAAGPLRQGRGFALCAQGPELDASSCTLVSLRSAVTAGDRPALMPVLTRHGKIRGKDPTPTPHTISPLILQASGLRGRGSPGRSHRACCISPPVLGPQSARASVMYKKMKTPFSLPHSTGEGTEAQRRLKAPRTNGQIQG